MANGEQSRARKVMIGIVAAAVIAATAPWVCGRVDKYKSRPETIRDAAVTAKCDQGVKLDTLPWCPCPPDAGLLDSKPEPETLPDQKVPEPDAPTCEEGQVLRRGKCVTRSKCGNKVQDEGEKCGEPGLNECTEDQRCRRCKCVRKPKPRPTKLLKPLKSHRTGCGTPKDLGVNPSYYKPVQFTVFGALRAYKQDFGKGDKIRIRICRQVDQDDNVTYTAQLMKGTSKVPAGIQNQVFNRVIRALSGMKKFGETTPQSAEFDVVPNF